MLTRKLFIFVLILYFNFAVGNQRYQNIIVNPVDNTCQLRPVEPCPIDNRTIELLFTNLRTELTWKLDSISNKIQEISDTKFTALEHYISTVIAELIDRRCTDWRTMIEQVIVLLVKIENRPCVPPVPPTARPQKPCKKEITCGYKYKTPLYHLDIAIFNEATVRDSRGRRYLNLNVAIKADETGIILLSTRPDLGSYDFYEIVIGGYNNSRTYLVKNHDINEDTFIDTSYILNCNHWTNFRIEIYDGTLRLFKGGLSTTLITYNDDLFDKIEYIGFTSWGEGTAKFMFDCPEL